MSTSGSGIGVPVSPPQEDITVYDQFEELVVTPNCAVSLPRYAKIIGYDEAAFWGVVYENQYQIGCDPLWNEHQRMSLQNALAEAQQEIEQVVGYPLCPTYISGVYNDNPRWVDQQALKSTRLVTRYPRILAAGVPVTATIESSVTIDYETEEGLGVVGPLATDAASLNEIKIFYPDSDREIEPSRMTLSDGEVTIYIPLYRTVKQEFLNTPEGGIDSQIIGYFLSEVDVKRVYTDPSTQAVLVRPNCRNQRCFAGCSECTQDACIYVRDAYRGIVDIAPAQWDADTASWNSRIVCAAGYSIVRLNYLAGVRQLDLQAETAIVRLAHSKMGQPPCQCDRTRYFWERDYEVPSVLTRERLNCPFGLSNGAWVAYRWALSFANKRASIF